MWLSHRMVMFPTTWYLRCHPARAVPRTEVWPRGSDRCPSPTSTWNRPWRESRNSIGKIMIWEVTVKSFLFVGASVCGLSKFCWFVGACFYWKHLTIYCFLIRSWGCNFVDKRNPWNPPILMNKRQSAQIFSTVAGIMSGGQGE